MDQDAILTGLKELRLIMQELDSVDPGQKLPVAIALFQGRKIDELRIKVEDLRVSFDLSTQFASRPHPMNRIILSDLRPVLGARAYEGLMELARKRHKTGEGRPDEMLLANFLTRVIPEEVIKCNHVGKVAFSRFMNYIETLNIPLPNDWTYWI